MISLFSNKYFQLIIRVIIGFVFIFAGMEKISDPEGFAVSISNYKAVPIWTVNFFAIIIPWIEVVSGLFLIFGIFIKENTLIISSLLVVFIILVAYAMIRGLDIECGCFGTMDGARVGFKKILENTLMLIGGIILIMKPNNAFLLVRIEDK